MTEELRDKYAEDKVHYDVIREIVQDEFKPIIRNLNWFFIIALSSIGYLFVKTSELSNDKANSNEVVGKLQYYQIEKDEHRMLLELEPDVNKGTNVFNKINDNIAEKLGFKYTTMGGER